jgi:hypothetical protein
VRKTRERAENGVVPAVLNWALVLTAPCYKLFFSRVHVLIVRGSAASLDVQRAC